MSPWARSSLRMKMILGCSAAKPRERSATPRAKTVRMDFMQMLRKVIARDRPIWRNNPEAPPFAVFGTRISLGCAAALRHKIPVAETGKRVQPLDRYGYENERENYHRSASPNRPRPFEGVRSRAGARLLLR